MPSLYLFQPIGSPTALNRFIREGYEFLIAYSLSNLVFANGDIRPQIASLHINQVIFSNFAYLVLDERHYSNIVVTDHFYNAVSSDSIVIL